MTIKKRLLITGANGLVGKYLLKMLRQQHEIFAVVRELPLTILPDVHYLTWDLAKDLTHPDLPKKIDVIIHLAQSNHMRDFPQHALDIFNVNVSATASLLNYAHKSAAEKFIYASTGGLYGACAEPFLEGDSVAIGKGALNYYFRSKYAAENLVLGYSELMSVHILRPFFIYGEHQKQQMLITRLIHRVINGEPVSLQGSDGIAINPVHVHDVVKLIAACFNQPAPAIINVAGSEVLSIRKIAEIIGGLTGKRPIFAADNSPANNILANNHLMQQILNCPLMSFEEGVVTCLNATCEDGQCSG